MQEGVKYRLGRAFHEYANVVESILEYDDEIEIEYNGHSHVITLKAKVIKPDDVQQT